MSSWDPWLQMFPNLSWFPSRGLSNLLKLWSPRSPFDYLETTHPLTIIDIYDIFLYVLFYFLVMVVLWTLFYCVLSLGPTTYTFLTSIHPSKYYRFIPRMFRLCSHCHYGFCFYSIQDKYKMLAVDPLWYIYQWIPLSYNKCQVTNIFTWSKSAADYTTSGASEIWETCDVRVDSASTW